MLIVAYHLHFSQIPFQNMIDQVYPLEELRLSFNQFQLVCDDLFWLKLRLELLLYVSQLIFVIEIQSAEDLLSLDINV